MIAGSRLAFLLSLIAASCLALVALGCGAEETGGPAESRALLDKAFSKPLKSADVQLELKMDLKGADQLSGPVALKLSGPYRLNGRDQLPSLDWDVSFSGGGVNLRGGLVVTRDNAYVRLGGTSYEVGRESFAALSREVAALQPGEGLGLDALGIDLTSWLRDAKLEDGEDVAGESTRQVSGPVDVRRVVLDVVGLTRSPAVRKELEAEGLTVPALPKPTEKELVQIESSVDKFDVEVNVGEDDTVRRFFTELDFDFRGNGDSGEVTAGEVTLGYVLSEPEGEPDIRAPEQSRPLSELLDRFGLGGLGGGPEGG